MYLEAVLHSIEDVLISADDEEFREDLAADLRAFLNGEDDPARFDAPASRALALF